MKLIPRITVLLCQNPICIALTFRPSGERHKLLEEARETGKHSCSAPKYLVQLLLVLPWRWKKTPSKLVSLGKQVFNWDIRSMSRLLVGVSAKVLQEISSANS